MIELEELLNVAGQHARLCLVEMKQSALMPVWLLIDAKDKATIIGTPWHSEAEKRNVMLQMRLEMRRRKVVTYSFMTEAWTAHAQSDQVEDILNVPEELMPRNRADRQEVVIACAVNKEKVQWRQWAIIRNWEETIIGLEERPFPACDTLKGWPTEMLKTVR